MSDFKNRANSVIDSIDSVLLEVPFGRTEQVTPILPSYASDNPYILIEEDREKESEMIREEIKYYEEVNEGIVNNYSVQYPLLSIYVDGIEYSPEGYKYHLFADKGEGHFGDYIDCSICSFDNNKFFENLEIIRREDLKYYGFDKIDLGTPDYDWFDNLWKEENHEG